MDTNFSGKFPYREAHLLQIHKGGKGTMGDILQAFGRSSSFETTWKKLNGEQQKIALTKLQLLYNNPKHPSLKAHRLHRSHGTWECYISAGLRLLYRYHQQQIHLLEIGNHRVIERCHQKHYSS